MNLYMKLSKTQNLTDWFRSDHISTEQSI